MPTVPPAPLSPNAGIFSYGLIGDASNIYQPGWNITKDTKGLVEGTIKIRRTSDTQAMPPVPVRGDPHPYDATLKCYKVEASFGNLGEVGITAQYIGIEKDPTDAEFEFTGSTSEESIVFHKDFKSWAVEKYALPDNPNTGQKGTPVQYKKQYVDVDEAGNFVRFKVGAPADFGGVESYLVPKATCRVSFYTGRTSTVTQYQSSIGKVFKSPAGMPSQLIADTGGNWLMTSISIQEHGIIYKVQAEYMLSSFGAKWNPYIYGSSGGDSTRYNSIESTGGSIGSLSSTSTIKHISIGTAGSGSLGSYKP